HRGVVNNEAGTAGRCLLIDVGGGSCEVTLSERRRLAETVSLPLGAVRLTEEFLKADPPAKEEIGRMKQFVARELRKAQRRVTPNGVQSIIATSGTAAALWEATRIIRKARARDYVASTKDIRRLAEKLTRLKNEERSAIPGIGPRRSEIVVAGAQVYAELLEHFSLPGFRYSEMGLRDGILAQMLAEQDPRTIAHQQYERDRWQAVLETCRRYGVDPRQAEPVRQHATQLFHDMREVHELPPEYQLWVETAAMLRDIGKFMNYQGHHRHAQYIISNSEIFGFNATQRVVTSAIARYIGKSRPAPEGRTMRQVPPEEHEHVKRAVVLLRLAVALNQDRASDVLRVKVRVYPRQVILELSPGRTGAELELWSLRKEADYFREVFRRELFVTLL
ncbi:MAG: exopolyphosphatase, partial [Silvibacterium sp.]|nr:exopolyphosphatase [Silvibacterium sp.]